MRTLEEEISYLQSLGLLDLLLKDKTTNSNIIWGTNEYAKYGSNFKKDKEITSKLIVGKYSKIIRSRAEKGKKDKLERSKEYAEVFTPYWVCEKMNNYVDDIWKKSKSDWKKNIRSNRLEITCGEAPFLVSRYDANSGDYIQIKDRIGLLDKKLHLINENVSEESDWLKWVDRAFQSTYGYEFQGDNVLIARLNLVLTFEEYLLERWNRKPRKNEYKNIIEIISWNIWQMDGLTYTIPYFEPQKEYEQIELFNNEKRSVKSRKKPLCRIFDWQKKECVRYYDLEEGSVLHMKFDFIIGNPPYQEDVSIIETKNGQKRSQSIFHFFQMQADKIAKISSILIYPGSRWIHRAGKGMDSFGLMQINDHHLARLDYYPVAREVFNMVDIADGISIVCKLYNKKESGFEYHYVKGGSDTVVQAENPGKELFILNPDDLTIMNRVEKFVEKYNINYLSEAIFPQKMFGIESDFVEKHPSKVRPYKKGDSFDPKTEVKLYTNDKAGKAGRANWYITSRNLIPTNSRYIDQWQVVVSSFSGGGQKRDNQLEIIDNQSAFGRVRVALRSFVTQEEAENFYKYVSSYLIRFTFLMTEEALTSLGKRVPDILNYSANNGIIDFTKDVDGQLFDLIGLNEDDITYVKERVDNIRKKQ